MRAVRRRRVSVTELPYFSEAFMLHEIMVEAIGKGEHGILVHVVARQVLLRAWTCPASPW